MAQETSHTQVMQEVIVNSTKGAFWKPNSSETWKKPNNG